MSALEWIVIAASAVVYGFIIHWNLPSQRRAVREHRERMWRDHGYDLL